MQVSYFETGRYYAPSNLPRQWPMPAGAYDREAGSRAFRGMVERSRYASEHDQNDGSNRQRQGQCPAVLLQGHAEAS